MAGLWSSPDLPALAKLASINRDGLGLTRGWWRIPAKLVKTIATPPAAEHGRPAPVATSPRTTTSATTSTGCSSTRR